MNSFLTARPRRAPWVEELQSSDAQLRLTNPKTLQSLDLNQSSKLIWTLCEGVHSTAQIIQQLCQAYPQQANLEHEISEIIDALSNGNFLVFDGGRDALEYTGGVVRKHQPNAELESALNEIKDFLLTELKVFDAPEVDGDLEQSLNGEALLRAMLNDADSARSNDDSKVVSYQRAMSIPLIADNVERAISHLHRLLPEVESDIEISGNAIYLRGSHMGWHSNHSRSDGRIYCSWAERDEANFFRYQHPLSGEIVTDWEQAGWNIKSFTIPPRPYRFWHCIGAASVRLSIGFRYNLPKLK